MVAALSAMLSTSVFASEQGVFVAVDSASATLSGADFGGAASNVSFLGPGALQVSGGYHYSPNLGVEGGLVSFGDSSVISSTFTETLQTSVAYVSANGTYPINSQFDLFGKLGLASTKIDYKYNSTAGSVYNVSGSNTNLMYGLGAQYNFNKNWGIRVQYENFGKADLAFKANWVAVAATTKSVTVTTTGIGVVYNF